MSHFSRERGGAKLKPLAYGGSTGGGLAVLRGAIDEVVVVSIASIVSGRCIFLFFEAMALCCGSTALHCRVCLRVGGVVGAAAREVALLH